ncbi:Lnb N-terminal periplasmic domain-containing protein [Bartonella sp. LJL80]
MTFIRNFLRVIWTFLAFLGLLWCLFGFWYQLPGGKTAFIIVAVLWSAAGVYGLINEWRKAWTSRILLILMFCGFAVWWATIRPSLERDWAPELAHTVSGSIDRNSPDTVYLVNIRDFDWITTETAHEKWISGTYDANAIVGMDIYLSYWMGPYIAHTLVGFTFSDGRHLVFSAEIRREKGESFSAIGGFFKQFELAMIAATEEDIIKLRTDIRKENVYRYPLKVEKEKMRELFLTYVTTANALADKAHFYNTLTANCTTVVFDMARILDPGIPLDWRILFSGQLPAYLYNHKMIDTQKPLEQTVQDARIAPQNDVPRIDYSRAIRMGENRISN